MPRIVLNLNEPTDLQTINGTWKVGKGFVPGEPNEGLTSKLSSSPPRLSDYDDSNWPICTDLRQSLSEGFTFAWYRIKIRVPEQIKGTNINGYRVFLESNFDNYGEIWVNGTVDRTTGTIVGINSQQRVEISDSATPNQDFVVACLVLNGPLAEPRGGIFIRYCYLAFEATDN